MSYFLKFLLGFLFVFLLVPSFGQSFKAYKKAGDLAMKNKDFYTAMFHYRDAIKIKPKDISTAFQLAEAARQFKAYDTAEKYYRIVLRSQERKNFPLTNFHLASVYKDLGKYQLAKDYYEDYLNLNQIDEYRALAKEEIASCDWALDFMNQAEEVQVTPLGKKINSPYSDFGALLSGDTLFYSSFKFDNAKDEFRPARKITKILYSKSGGKGRTMRSNFNEETRHTAHTAISLNGQRIYFTICEYINANQIRCLLYYREKDKRGRWRGKPIRLPESINKKGFTSTHPSIGFDSIEQKEVLFFASDRDDGVGGMDIWMTKVGEEKNQFEAPILLKKLNTKADEFTPFFHTQSQILYFSSDRLPSLGGYDTYSSKKENLTWSQLTHLKPPINTSFNDVYFSLSKEGKTGFISSNRPGAMYLDEDNKACCNDIFQIKWPEEKESTDGIEIVEQKKEPIIIPPVPIEPEVSKQEVIVPERLEDFLPLALYFDNDEPDKATRRSTTKKNYVETFKKYYAQKEGYLQVFPDSIQKMNSFFEEEVKRGYHWLLKFSEILLNKLNEGETVEIFIKGYTSPRAKSDYNLFLGKRRISSLRNHFEAYSNKAFQPFIESGNLKITERSFGETTASSMISDVLEDRRNSIYSLEAAKERRVEIIEIKREK